MNNLHAERKLKETLEQIEDDHRERMTYIQRETIDVKMELRAFKFKAMKNSLKRHIGLEDPILRKISVRSNPENSSYRKPGFKLMEPNHFIWHKSKTFPEMTVITATFPSNNMGDRQLKSQPPGNVGGGGFSRAIATSADVAGREKKDILGDIHMLRLLQKASLEAKELGALKPANMKKKRSKSTDFLHEVNGIDLNRYYGDGATELAIRKLEKRKRQMRIHAIIQGGKTSVIRDSANNNLRVILPTSVLERGNNEPRKIPERRLSREEKLELLSKPTQKTSLHVYVPKLGNYNHGKVAKDENDRLSRLKVAEEKERYVEVVSKIQRFLGFGINGAKTVEYEKLSEEEKLVYDRIRKSVINVRAVSRAKIFVTKLRKKVHAKKLASLYVNTD